MMDARFIEYLEQRLSIETDPEKQQAIRDMLRSSHE